MVDLPAVDGPLVLSEEVGNLGIRGAEAASFAAWFANSGR
jgi:hypothetical protein